MIINVFILTTAIGIGSVRSPSSEKEDALKALSKAAYIQMDLKPRIKELEKKIIPEQIKEYGGWITVVAKITNEKKISLEWTF